MKTLVHGQRDTPGPGIKPFGSRPVPQSLGEISVREIAISADYTPLDFNPAAGVIHGYFTDDQSQTDLYPNLRLTQNLGVLRAGGTESVPSLVWAAEIDALWYIVAGEFGTRYKAKVKTADIAPDDQDTVTLYWQDANSGSPSLVTSGIDVSAVNRLTGTVAKNQFVEVEFNPADYAWWIVGIDDPVFLVDFELKNNLTTGGTATAWKFTFSAGVPNIVRNAAHEITVRDPHGQFRGVGQSVRSSGGSRGKAVWVEDSPAQYRGYQILEMQKPAYLLKYSIQRRQFDRPQRHHAYRHHLAGDHRRRALHDRRLRRMEFRQPHDPQGYGFFDPRRLLGLRRVEQGGVKIRGPAGADQRRRPLEGAVSLR